MRIYYLLLINLLLSCSSPNEEDGKPEVKAAGHTAFTTAAKIITKGIPEGFLQRDYTISPDGNIAYTTMVLPNRSRRFILQLDLTKDLAVLATFSGDYNDMEPFLTPDGKFLLFASDRPLTKEDSIRDYNLWYAGVDDLTVKEPKAFSKIINTEEDEFYPTMNLQGDLYFTARYNSDKDDIYRAARNDSGFTEPERLPFCQPEFYEFNAFISPDDKLIIFSSYGRSGEVGGGDIYYSVRDSSGEWQEVKMAGNNLNTTSLDYSPFLRKDTLYFTSRRQDASWTDKKFSYLAEIAAHSDSAAIGEQGIYIMPWTVNHESEPNTD